MRSETLVIQNELCGEARQHIYKLVLQGSLGREAQPGQFLHIRVPAGYDPLLRRPLSIAQIDRYGEQITVFYRVQGKGTQLLSTVRVGEPLDVLGPLGNGFTVPAGGELWLVAGGIGSFPLYALAEAALANGVAVRLFWGGENREFLESAGLALWDKLGIPLYISTMDGSMGHQGLVTELLEAQLRIAGIPAAVLPIAKDNPAGSFEQKQESSTLLDRTTGDTQEPKQENRPRLAPRLAVCGPHAMLKAVSGLAGQAGLAAEVSMEERMGCAVGACLGCVTTLRSANGQLRRAKVCQDGPVFRAEEVAWNANC